MTDRTARARELHLYRQYFELVAAGTKTVEVRVKYPRLANLTADDTIRFRIICGPEKEALGALVIAITEQGT